MADGKPDLALQQFEKAAALDPDNPAIKTRIGVSEINTGQSEQGLATLEQVFGTEAGAPIAGPALVITEFRARRFDKAAEVASSLIQRDPKNPIYHTLLGEVRAAQQDYSGAESAPLGRSTRIFQPPHAISREFTRLRVARTRRELSITICSPKTPMGRPGRSHSL